MEPGTHTLRTHTVANGCRLLAAFPMRSGIDVSAGVYIMAERPELDVEHQYVVAWMASLDSTSWSQGYYYHDANEAMAAALAQAGWTGVVGPLIESQTVR